MPCKVIGGSIIFLSCGLVGNDSLEKPSINWIESKEKEEPI